MRTAILISAVSLLVAALVFSLAFGRRVSSSIKLMSERLGADLIIVPTGSRGAAEDILLENRVKSFYMDRNVLDKIKAIKGIRAVTHQTYLVTLTSLCCSVPESMVVVFDQDTDFIVKPWLKEDMRGKIKRGEAIAGSESAFNIDVGLVDVSLFGNAFKIVGVLDKTATGLDNALFVTEDSLKDILNKSTIADFKPGKISIIFAKVQSGYDPYKVAREIEDSIIEVDAVARKDIGKNIITTLKDINMIFTIMIVLAIILSLFLTWSMFSAIANERAKEIGIMRAIGAKERHVVSLFLIEIVFVGFIGGAVGIVVGEFLYRILSKWFTIFKNLPVNLSVYEYIFIAVVGLLSGIGICMAGALSPIMRLRRLEPLVIIKED
ncbi:permease [Dissulfurispira thermophila]|uniref:Permease n=1 Tax=Dissulfurispira thermophila TaxID=2715679 RepID=A0A7G1H3X3_9BACT|nr:FtsX-like permease family protein [Dissulfurispira thermophila]BCB96823.1 permease [Dissulfurispira thermophila]